MVKVTQCFEVPRIWVADVITVEKSKSFLFHVSEDLNDLSFVNIAC